MKAWKKKIDLYNGRDEEDTGPDASITLSIPLDSFKEIQATLGKTLVAERGKGFPVDLRKYMSIEPKMTLYTQKMVKKADGHYENDTIETESPYHSFGIKTYSNGTSYTGEEQVFVSIYPSEHCGGKAILEALSCVSFYELDEYFNEKVRTEVLLNLPDTPEAIDKESPKDQEIIRLFANHSKKQTPLYVWDKDNFPGVAEVDWEKYPYVYGNVLNPRKFKEEWVTPTGWKKIENEVYKAYFKMDGDTLLTAGISGNVTRTGKGMPVETFAEIVDADIIRRINNVFGTAFVRADFKDPVYYAITVNGKDADLPSMNALQANTKKNELERIGFRRMGVGIVPIASSISSVLGNDSELSTSTSIAP